MYAARHVFQVDPRARCQPNRRMLRTFALMLIASTGCMTEDTSSLESEATESTLNGTRVNPSPALYQVMSMFFGQGTFHMTAADLMDGNTVTRGVDADRSEEHTSELQSRLHLVCRLLLE